MASVNNQFQQGPGLKLANAFVQHSVELNQISPYKWTEAAKAAAYPITRGGSWAIHRALASAYPASNPKESIERIHALATPNGISHSAPLAKAENAPTENWPEKIDRATKDLGDKLSAFATLLQMREWAGIQDIAETDNLDLMALAKKATENPNTSVWKLFKAKYHPSFFQQLKAGFFYLLFYPHLLGSTIDAYLHEVIAIVKRKLTSENDQTRNEVFKELIQNLYVFFVGHYEATEDFARGIERQSPNKTVHRTLEELRNYRIENLYGFDLKELCAFFGQAMMEASSVTVPLAPSILKRIPLIGWALRKLEAFLNYFIIRKVIQSVLPGVLENSIDKGIELSKPSNLPFSNALAIFLREQLEELYIKITTPTLLSESEAQPIPGMGTLLPDAITELQNIVRLAPYTKILELRRKIKGLEEEKPGIFDFFDSTANEAIKESLTDACHILFRYLNESARSGKLFANLLESSAGIFAEGEKDPDVLSDTFKKEREKINEIGACIIKQLLDDKVPQAIEERIDSLLPSSIRGTPRNIRLATDTLFDTHQAIATAALKAIRESSAQILSKTDHLDKELIHKELSAILKQARDLTYRVKSKKREEKKNEIEDPVLGLSITDQDALWRQLSAFYEQLEEEIKGVLKLQELQNGYSAYESLEKQLGSIQPQKKEIDDLIRQLKALPKEEIEDLKEKIEALQTLAPQLAKEKQAQKELKEIALHLQKIYAYEQNKHKWFYKPAVDLAVIRQILANASFMKKDEMQSLLGNGSKLLAKRNQFDTLFADLQKTHGQNETLLEQIKVTLSDSWVQGHMQSVQARKQTIQNEMQASANTLVREIDELLSTLQNQRSPLSPTLTPLREATTALAASILVTSLVSYVPYLRPAAPAFGALFGSFASHVSWSQPMQEQKPPATEKISPNTTLTQEQTLPTTEEISPNTTWKNVLFLGKELATLASPAILSLVLDRFPLPTALNQLAVNAAAPFAAGHFARNRFYSYIRDTVVAPKVHEFCQGFLRLSFAEDGLLFKAFWTSSIKSAGEGFRKLAKK